MASVMHGQSPSQAPQHASHCRDASNSRGLCHHPVPAPEGPAVHEYLNLLTIPLVRCSQIELENKVLLSKMSRIMQKSPCRLANCKSTPSLLELKPSLNRGSRKKELIKITIENQALLKRMQNSKPAYDRGRLKQEFEENSQRVKSICEHPFRLYERVQIQPGTTASTATGSTSVRFLAVRPEE